MPPIFKERPCQRPHTEEQAAKPGEARLEPVQKIDCAIQRVTEAGLHDAPQSHPETEGVLEFMPELGAQHAGDHGRCHDDDGIRVDGVALQVQLQDCRSGHGAEPHQDAEGAGMPRSNV